VFQGEVRRCSEELGFTAIKLQPKYQPLNPVSPRSDFFFETAVKHNLTLVAHTGDGLPLSAPSLFIAPARRFPDLRIVLGHAGGSIFFLEAIVAAQVCPNVYIELSSLMPHHITDVVEYIASDRLLIGSDLPESIPAEIGKIVNHRDLTDAQKQDILWNTASGLFLTK
jgi:predicted TIM-barrel fold metal-dependent hydrolase